MQTASTTTAEQTASDKAARKGLSLSFSLCTLFCNFNAVPSQADVPLHVQGEVVRAGEGPLAHSALERSVPCVLPEVAGQLV